MGCHCLLQKVLRSYFLIQISGKEQARPNLTSISTTPLRLSTVRVTSSPNLKDLLWPWPGSLMAVSAGLLPHHTFSLPPPSLILPFHQSCECWGNLGLCSGPFLFSSQVVLSRLVISILIPSVSADPASLPCAWEQCLFCFAA